jgi:uncharacterized protein (DUF1501 family)
MGSRLTRRQILTGAALAAAAGGAGRSLSALASVTIGPRGKQAGGDALVVLFLRGGADGLNIVVPYADDDYHRLRPSLGLPGPKDRGVEAKARALDLDGFFGLHPALAPLLPLYQAGQLAAVHAIGSGDQTRSHFEAMATMERGLARDTGTASGWLARHLASTAGEADSPLRAVAIAETMPDSLRGATNATALMTLSEYRLAAPNVMPTGSGGKVFHAAPTPSRADAITETLHGLYGAGEAKAEQLPLKSDVDVLRSAGRETLAALEAVKRLDAAHYRPENGAVYPKTEMGNGMLQAACLIKGGVGLEIACLDMGGWDTHVAQGRDTGWQAGRLEELGKALAAFAQDLGASMAHVTTVVMTEFGRRAYENTGLGTDHGRASCMFLMGGGVRGGKVYGTWPGLAENKLEDHGDLRVTTDYRDVLSEVLSHRLKNDRLAEVFPDYTPNYHHILRPLA